MPAQVGYQPTLKTEMGASCRSASPRRRTGSVTSIQAIYVPADDYTDPAPASVFAHLKATTALSRSISEKGIYPAVDPLKYDVDDPQGRHPRRGPLPRRGEPRQGDPAALQGAQEHHRDPRHRRALPTRKKQADGPARAGNRAGPLAADFVAEQLTGSPGPTVHAIAETIRGFEEIIKASTTRFPGRRSSSRARSTRSSRPRRAKSG